MIKDILFSVFKRPDIPDVVDANEKDKDNTILFVAGSAVLLAVVYLITSRK